MKSLRERFDIPRLQPEPKSLAQRNREGTAFEREAQREVDDSTTDATRIARREAQPRKIQTKRVRLDINARHDAKKMARLLADGWVVSAQSKRGLLTWNPGATDYVLTHE